MIKVLEFFQRRADLSHADFLDHWRGRHTSVVMGITGIRRYVQNPVRHDLTDNPRFDGVVELWFSSVAMMRANGQGPYWPEVIADEERFIDRSTTRLLLIDDPAPPPVVPGLRQFVLLRRPTTVSDAAFAAALDRLIAGFGRTIVREDDPESPLPLHVDRPFRRRAEAPFVDAVLSIQDTTMASKDPRRTAPWRYMPELETVAELLTDCRPIVAD
jgi:uncharacterized protein (TIGR02118 family)